MYRFLQTFLMAFFAISSLTPQMIAQTENQQYRMFFRNGTFIPDNNVESINSKNLSTAYFYDNYYVLVQFNSIPGNHEKSKLVKAGIHLLEYIPENAYFASFPEDMLNANLREFNIRALYTINPKFKIDRRLSENIPSYAINKEGYVDIVVSFFRNIPINTIIEEIKLLKIELLSSNDRFHRLKLRVSEDMLNDITALSWVMWIEPVHPPLKEVNLPGKTNNKSNVLGANYPGARNLTGKSVIIGEWDNGPVGDHIDYNFRLTNKQQDSAIRTHATHVAGTMAGAGLIDPYCTGMAPEAEIFSWDFFGDIPHEMDSAAQYDNIMITQNSYAYDPDEDTCEIKGLYDEISRDLDKLTITYSHLIHVFAAGNFKNQCPGGFGTVSGGFQAAKNPITIGAVNLKDQMSWFSSWGPVKDGRLKPDVCAVGVAVKSTLPNNVYSKSTWNGTSMACPAASGIIAQIYQRYRQLYRGNPRSTTIKAIVCNTAEDLGKAGPDYKFGFGRINGYAAVNALEDIRFKEEIAFDSVTNIDSITVPANINQLKVLICWNDVESLPNVAKALINDLDIVVVDTLGNIFYPKVLDPGNPDNLAVSGIDTLNNIEQVIIDNPVSGKYYIKVKGASIPSGQQEYSMTYEFITAEVKVTYPIGIESLTPGETEYIRWDAHGTTGYFKVEFSFNNGMNWSILDTALNSYLRYFEWQVPDTISGMCLIKVTSGNSISGESDTTFSIMYKPDTLYAIPCNEQIHLIWNNVPSAIGYEVFIVDSGKWNAVGNTSDTFFTVFGLDNNETYWFSVRATSMNIATGQKINAISATPDSLILPPTITFHPTIDTICENKIGILFAKASGTKPIFQQWQYRINSVTPWQDFMGEIDTFLILLSVTSAFEGVQIRAYFYNSCQTKIYSNYTTIHVDNGYEILKHPDSVITCAGDTSLFSFSIAGTPRYSIQWQQNYDTSTIWYDILGANDTILILNDVQHSQNNNQFRAKITSKCSNVQYTDSVTLKIRPELLVDVFSDKDTICYGDTVILTATGSGGDTSNYAFNWNVNPSSSKTIWDTPSVVTTYIITLYDDCSLVPVKDSVTTNVMKVDVNWTYNSDWLSVDFTPEDTGKAKYDWSFGDGSNSNEKFPNHIYSNDTTYEVCLKVTDDFGCSSISCQEISVQKISVQDLISKRSFRIIPNPNTGKFRIDISKQDWINGSITIYSVMSKEIILKEYITSPLNSIDLDLSKNKSGTYFIELKLGKEVYIGKLLIQ